MNLGDVFHFVGIADTHTWMIITDPAVDPLRVVMVNFTSDKPTVERACVVQVGEHPRITTRSLIYYKGAKIAKDADLEKLKQAKRLVLMTVLDGLLLDRIQQGVLNSVDIDDEVAEVLFDQGIIQ